MTQPYPLYDELVAKIPESSTVDINRVSATINSISTNLAPDQAAEHYREIAALILHHESLTNNGVLLTPVPYGGKTMTGGKGLLYTITNLPAQLQQIIALYVTSVSETK